MQSIVARGAELAGGDGKLVAAFRTIRPLPCPPPAPRCPPDDFFARVAPAARNRGERAWLGLISYGLRKGEMLGLTPDAIDLETGEVRVCRQRGRAQRKNREPYIVEVDADTLDDLRWTIEHRAELRSRFGWHRGRVDGHVFPWAEKYLELFLRRVRRELGADVERYLPRGTGWHAWRHRMARDARDRGESELEIADRLGDRTTDMARRYSRRGEMRNRLTPERRPCQRVHQVAPARAPGRSQPTLTTPGVVLEWAGAKEA